MWMSSGHLQAKALKPMVWSGTAQGAMEKKNKTSLDVISCFLKRGKKQVDDSKATAGEVEDDQWIFLQEKQVKDDQQLIASVLVVVGLILLYVNYFDFGSSVSRMVSLCAALVVIVTGLLISHDTKP